MLTELLVAAAVDVVDETAVDCVVIVAAVSVVDVGDVEIGVGACLAHA